MQKLRLGLALFFVVALSTFVGGVPSHALDTIRGISTSTVKVVVNGNEEREGTYLGEVVQILSKEVREVPNTNTKATYQTVQVRFLQGEEKKGTEITVEDAAFALEVGDKVYVKYLYTNGMMYYSIQEPYRIPALIFLLVVFIVAVVLLGGKQGFLALIALFISFGVIFKFLFPELLTGGNVIVISTLGALLSLFVVMYLTHGFTRMTTASFLGCSIAVIITVLLAKYAVWVTNLTGFSEEESVYLNIATQGNLDFVALLIGGIIIGVIGVIDDASITQASVVQEILRMNGSLSFGQVYSKAIKIGKDHVGAVINTLILAYTGASLPLVLLLYTSTTPILELINREGVATEIVRAVVGSIGILCAVPLTTLIAILLMKGKQFDTTETSSHTHHHTHSHA